MNLKILSNLKQVGCISVPDIFKPPTLQLITALRCSVPAFEVGRHAVEQSRIC